MSENRRTLLKVLGGVVGGGAALSVAGPVIQGALVPGRPTVTGTGTFVKVAELRALPEDGTPTSVPVVVEAPIDGWNRMPPTEIGSVWLVREGDEVQAFSTICPHLGCTIDWEGGSQRFFCPCHTTYFTPDGKVISGPSPRSMDRLETRLVEGAVEVKYEKFSLGTAEQKPV